MFEDNVIPTPEAVGDIAICIIVSGELERQAEVTINQVGGSAQCEYYLYLPCTTQTEHGWQDMHCMVIIHGSLWCLCSHVAGLTVISLLSAPDDFRTQFPLSVTLEVPLACFVVELTDDDIIEDAESFVLQLSSSDPSVIVTNNNTVTIIIEDNDCMLMLDTIVSALHVYMYMYMHLHTKSGVSFIQWKSTIMMFLLL